MKQKCCFRVRKKYLKRLLIILFIIGVVFAWPRVVMAPKKKAKTKTEEKAAAAEPEKAAEVTKPAKEAKPAEEAKKEIFWCCDWKRLAR